ncbi:hypothetical protein DPEC_G00187430 [Dallia pectoralis]|uniref:Uncharacterized protein n=1 Tax=Dallia pectoralis TaxID=75939 RepID=A0ACC2GC63_DALPE|nr:hypothetical protein DPEC_G00187430 [Dallia pectoralis]
MIQGFMLLIKKQVPRHHIKSLCMIDSSGYAEITCSKPIHNQENVILPLDPCSDNAKAISVNLRNKDVEAFLNAEAAIEDKKMEKPLSILRNCSEKRVKFKQRK